jgi:hypothetical protein
MANGNLRLIFDNAADRGSLVASSQVGALTVDNLRNEKKAYVWRSATLNESLNLTWDALEPIGGVILAFNNLTPFATMRVRGYINAGDTTPDFDTGAKACQPIPTLKYLSLLNPIGENAYTPGGASQLAFGSGGYGAVWAPELRSVRRLQIDISDAQNALGYIESSRLVVGRFWEPLYNFDFGHAVQYMDGGKSERSEAGDVRMEQGAKWRRVSLSLSYMDPIDRATLLRIARVHGATKPFFFSAFPENDDRNLEQVYQLWGKFTESPRIANPRYDAWASSLDIEEM